MKGRRKKTKYSMVFATMVAMLSVCTAGVSTFAWFQASSEVRVSAASSSTTITVADPSETAATGLYVFQDNFDDSGDGDTAVTAKRIIGKFPSQRRDLPSSIAFDGEKATKTNFKQLATSKNAYYTAASSFLPGQRISFAILINGTASKSRTLSINAFTSSAITNVHRYLHDGSQATNKEIVLADAINVYATAISGTFDEKNNVFESTVSAADPDEATTSATISKFLKSNQNAAGSALSDVFMHSPGDTTTPYTLVTSASSEDTLFLYTIEFSDANVDHYRRVSDADTPTPVSDTPTFESGETTYWQRDNSSGTLNGTSTVFQGLPFNITSLFIM